MRKERKLSAQNSSWDLCRLMLRICPRFLQIHRGYRSNDLNANNKNLETNLHVKSKPCKSGTEGGNVSRSWNAKPGRAGHCFKIASIGRNWRVQRMCPSRLQPGPWPCVSGHLGTTSNPVSSHPQRNLFMFHLLHWELVSNLNCVSSDKGPWQLLVINFEKNLLSLTLTSSNQLANYCQLFN